MERNAHEKALNLAKNTAKSTAPRSSTKKWDKNSQEYEDHLTSQMMKRTGAKSKGTRMTRSILG